MTVYLVTKTVTSDDCIQDSYEFEPIGVYSNIVAAKSRIKFVYDTYLKGEAKIYGANFVAKDYMYFDTFKWAQIIGESADPDDVDEYVVTLKIHEMDVED